MDSMEADTPQQATMHTSTLEHGKLIYEHFETQIHSADTKAQLTLAADTLLVAALTLTGQDAASVLLEGDATVGELVVTILSILALVALFTSIYHAILAAQPIVRIPNQRHSLFFFGHAAQYDEDAFIAAFKDQTESEIEDAILAQAYAKGVIANRKFARARRSI